MISNDDSYIYYPIILFTIVSTIILIYSYVIVEKAPLIGLFQGLDNTDLLKLRISVSRNFKGIVQLKNIFAIMLLPFLSYIAFSYLHIKGINKTYSFIVGGKIKGTFNEKELKEL